MAAAVAGILVAIPAAACAQGIQGVGALEELLHAGEAPTWYVRQLERSGYQVTAINYRRGNQVAYDVVKGDDNYEVELQIDRETGAVGNVAVSGNGRQLLAAGGATRLAPAVVIPSGTRLAVVLNDHIESGESRTGDVFTMTVTVPVVIAEDVAIPTGTPVRGHIDIVESRGTAARLALKADAMEIGGVTFEVAGLVLPEIWQQGDLAPGARLSIELAEAVRVLR